MRGSRRTILASSVVFQGLTAAELDPVLSASELVTRKPKELILSEGSPTDGLYIVLEGEVEVSCPSAWPAGRIGPVESVSAGWDRAAVSASMV